MPADTQLPVTDRLISLFWGRSAHDPAAVALVQDEEVWSRARLFDLAERIAGGFARAGLERGDRAVLHMRNRPEFVAAYLACFKAGVIAVTINPRLKPAEIAPLLERIEPALYIGQSDLYAGADRLADTALDIGRQLLVDAAAWRGFTAELPPPSFEAFPESMPAFLLPTSGTSGLPKFAIHTRRNGANFIEAATRSRTDKGAYTLVVLPMAHATASAHAISSVAYGGPVTLLDGFDAGRVLDEIERGRCHRMAILPYMVGALVDEQQARPRKVDALQSCVVGGDMLPPAIRARFEALFGPKLSEHYGSTEAAGFVPTGGHSFKATSSIEVRLLDAQKRVIPDGKEGELSVRGQIVAVGYWESPRSIRPLGPDGWFDTGDMVREVAPGEFVYVQRLKDIIIRGGSNIAPAEIEKALTAHPAVGAALVVGIPDEALGQRVAALIEPRAGGPAIDPQAVVAELAKSVADYKLPELIKIVGSLPRNNGGKLDRVGVSANLPQSWDLDRRPKGLQP